MILYKTFLVDLHWWSSTWWFGRVHQLCYWYLLP